MHACAEVDIDVDQSRAEQEALECAQRLTESHLGFKMSFRNGVFADVGYIVRSRASKLIIKAQYTHDFAGEGGKLVDVAFTHIDPKGPEQRFSALLRVDGGFESALLG